MLAAVGFANLTICSLDLYPEKGLRPLKTHRFEHCGTDVISKWPDQQNKKRPIFTEIALGSMVLISPLEKFKPQDLIRPIHIVGRKYFSVRFYPFLLHVTLALLHKSHRFRLRSDQI